MNRDTDENQWHESLKAYIGTVIYTQKRNPDRRTKRREPYETMSLAVREARKVNPW